MENLLATALNADSTYLYVFVASMRYIAPVLAFIILLRSILPLLAFRRDPEIWGWLCLRDGKKLPITHWENVIGRHKRRADFASRIRRIYSAGA